MATVAAEALLEPRVGPFRFDDGHGGAIPDEEIGESGGGEPEEHFGDLLDVGDPAVGRRSEVVAPMQTASPGHSRPHGDGCRRGAARDEPARAAAELAGVTVAHGPFVAGAGVNEGHDDDDDDDDDRALEQPFGLGCHDGRRAR